MLDPRKIISRVRALGGNLQIGAEGIEVVNSDKLPPEAEAIIRANSAAVAQALREEAAGHSEPAAPAHSEPDEPPPVILGATFFDMADLCAHLAFVQGNTTLRAASKTLALLSLDERRSAAFLASMAADHPVETPILASLLDPDRVQLERAA